MCRSFQTSTFKQAISESLQCNILQLWPFGNLSVLKQIAFNKCGIISVYLSSREVFVLLQLHQKDGCINHAMAKAVVILSIHSPTNLACSFLKSTVLIVLDGVAEIVQSINCLHWMQVGMFTMLKISCQSLSNVTNIVMTFFCKSYPVINKRILLSK